MPKSFVTPLSLRYRFPFRHALFSLALAVPAFLTGAAQNPPKSAEPSNSTAERPAIARPVPEEMPSKPANGTDGAGPDSSLRLGNGDLIEVAIYNVPELATKTRVGNNGDVYLPLVDYVHVAGLTTEEAQAVIEKRYADGGFLKDPHVTLFVDDYASQGVNVLGEVTKPGIYPVLGDQRLFGLISAAGGLTDKAGRSVTVTHRDPSDKPVTVALSRNITDNGDSNIGVFPGDTVLVHRADVIYVVGDVGKPSGFFIDTENLTVLKAIALAGGTNRTAKLSGTRIIRRGPNGMTETPVALKKILEAKAPDVLMQADDILFVPSSAGRVVVGRTLEAAMQAATAVSIVALHP